MSFMASKKMLMVARRGRPFVLSGGFNTDTDGWVRRQGTAGWLANDGGVLRTDSDTSGTAGVASYTVTADMAKYLRLNITVYARIGSTAYIYCRKSKTGQRIWLSEQEHTNGEYRLMGGSIADDTGSDLQFEFQSAQSVQWDNWKIEGVRR